MGWLFKPRFNRLDAIGISFAASMAVKTGNFWWLLVVLPFSVISVIGERRFS